MNQINKFLFAITAIPVTVFFKESFLFNGFQNGKIYFSAATNLIFQKRQKNTFNQTNDSITEERIIKKIFSIPEVKIKNRYIDSLTRHKSGISILIVKKPGANRKYYWVQAGYNNETRFEAYYNFCVYPNNLLVKFYDPMTDKILSLDEWRNKAKHKG